ncbi:signal recognition particle-docking protein FtsY [Lactobacillus terrae]|uniref:signal recognition particle-docking protein FtsY n=1 Tax=Lactobacillus terrae TaxID=2269374 RepID=UPI000C1B6D65|nr:signal recognition particle-docking protein FtsY [Lactobacillus terrae]
MGLFDRFKKTFSNEPKVETPEEETKETPNQEESVESESSQSQTDASELNKNEESDNISSTEEPSSEENDYNEDVELEQIEAEPEPEFIEETVEEADVEEPDIDDSETEETEVDNEEEEKEELKEYDNGLEKSRTSFSQRFNKFLSNFRSVDEDFFEDLEELLIESDVGYETAIKISDELREEVKLENAKKKSDVSDVIIKKMVDMYDEEGKEENNSLAVSKTQSPTVYLFVGVNGAGKTTTIGKLAHRFESQGKKVLLAAGDTFRAGAIDQLQEWGRRVNVDVQASAPQTDPASVAFDAVQRAVKDNYDVLLVDTAGRLQNKEGLMRELEKIKRVISREIPDAPQEVLLVLDGSTGQNALSQAKEFNKTTNVTGIVLTKLDGSSQGGIVLPIRNELHIPVKLVGLGESMDDLRDFDPEKFIYGLFKDLIISGESSDEN